MDTRLPLFFNLFLLAPSVGHRGGISSLVKETLTFPVSSLSHKMPVYCNPVCMYKCMCECVWIHVCLYICIHYSYSYTFTEYLLNIYYMPVVLLQKNKDEEDLKWYHVWIRQIQIKNFTLLLLICVMSETWPKLLFIKWG